MLTYHFNSLYCMVEIRVECTFLKVSIIESLCAYIIRALALELLVVSNKGL